jgi:trypsin
MFAMQIENVHSSVDHHRGVEQQFRQVKGRMLEDGPPEEIVVGDNETTRPYPYTTALYYTKDIDNQFCAGILILPDVVLTAAYCTTDVSIDGEWTIVACTDLRDRTDLTSERFHILEILPHPDYDDKTKANDFALLKLDRVSAALTVLMNGDETIPDAGEVVRVMGWGMLVSGGSSTGNIMLKQVDANAITNAIANEQCAAQYDEEEILDNMMCVFVEERREDPCQGGSGGPLVVANDESPAQDLLVGVVASWGYGCDWERSRRYAGVYSRVSNQIQWIKDNACGVTIESGDCKIKINTASPSSPMTHQVRSPVVCRPKIQAMCQPMTVAG